MALCDLAHKILLCSESEQNIIYDGATGNLPFITTESEVYLYDCPANVWKVGAILVDRDNTSDYGWEFISMIDDTDLSLEEYTLGGNLYYRVMNIRSWPARQNQVAQFQFVGLDPNDTTEVYHRMAYRQPTPITSDAIQHEMPIGTEHFLVEATVMLIKAINNPKDFEKVRLYIAKELKPQVSLELGKGEQGIPTFSRRRPF